MWGFLRVPAVGVGFRSTVAVRVIPLLPGRLHRGHHLGQEWVVGVIWSDEKHFLTRLLNSRLYSIALRHAGIVPPRTAARHIQPDQAPNPHQSGQLVSVRLMSMSLLSQRQKSMKPTLF